MGVLFVPIILIIALLFSSVKVVDQWERLAILTLGKFSGMKGPGLVLIIPIIQRVATRIDTRTISSKFQSETTLTKDGVSVTVQAVLFWRVISPEKATLEVINFRESVELAAQTTLRDAVGRMTLANILSNLKELDDAILESISKKVERWGILAASVEIRDVTIPKELQEVMSRSAQAEREKQARIIYGEAEVETAKKFIEASEIYASNPIAMQLRGMNILYEAVKSDQNSLIIVPSTMAESVNPIAINMAYSKYNKQKEAEKNSISNT